MEEPKSEVKNGPNVTYRITIVKTEHGVPYEDTEWKKLVDSPDENHQNIYGYVTHHGVTDVNTQVFEQVLDNLDLTKIVTTINEV